MKKYASFNTLWKHAKNYVAFSTYDYVASYNCFMWALEENAKNVHGEDFDSNKFDHFVQCYRFNAQQEQINYNRTIKQLCLSAYESYTADYSEYENELAAIL